MWYSFEVVSNMSDDESIAEELEYGEDSGDEFGYESNDRYEDSFMSPIAPVKEVQTKTNVKFTGNLPQNKSTVSLDDYSMDFSEAANESAY